MEGFVTQFDLASFFGLTTAVVTVIGLLKGLFPKWIDGKEPKLGLALSYLLGIISKLTIPGAFSGMQWLPFLLSLLGVAAGAKLGHDYVLNQVVKGKPDPTPPSAPAKTLLVAIILALAMGGCCSIETKTASDINAGQDMILPEYVSYVQADPKLSDAQKKDRALQAQKLREATQKLLR